MIIYLFYILCNVFLLKVILEKDKNIKINKIIVMILTFFLSMFIEFIYFGILSILTIFCP